MKFSLLSLAFAATILPALAQQQYHAGQYNVSAFSNYRFIKPKERTNASLLQTQFRQQFPNWNITVDKLSGQITNAFGDAVSLQGNTLDAKVQFAIANKLQALALNPNEWAQVRNTIANHASYIGFEQRFDGHKVVFSKLSFRFTPTGLLQNIQLKTYGKPAAGVAATLSETTALQAATADLSNVTITQNNIDPNWVWFPVPSATGYELRPAYSFNIDGKTDETPLELKGYVDGITGKILYRTNGVHETVNQTVKATVYKQNPLLPTSIEPMANLKMTIGSNTYYTDTAGVLNESSLSLPVNATIALEGKWSKVRAVLSSNVTPTFLDTILTNGGVFELPVGSIAADRHLNAYYHVNKVHDFMKGYFPSFTGMDYPLTTNVDVTGSCNAFYSSGSNSINFYAANATCNSFAYCGDIIYHEYGHAISDKFYQAQSVPSMQNGALNEGNSDIWGIGITHDPVLGKGSTNSGGIIRRYDQQPKVYPQDIVGEVHADGEIIAGAWWDVSVNIGSVDTMSQLFTKTYFDTPDGPDGTEGEVYHDVLISALMNDDNDANINNGTPHFNQIVAAFARHGIYLLGNATVAHTEVANQPINTPTTINASVNVTTPAFLQGVKLFYRNRVNATTPFDSLTMTAQGTNYTAAIPTQPEGSVMEYYFAVYDNSGFANTFAPTGYTPSSQVNDNKKNIPYQFGVGLAPRLVETFDATIDTSLTNSWKIGLSTDDATKGKWIQAVPVPSFLNSTSGQINVQTGADHTSGTGQCLVTGNASSPSSSVGVEDVDNGTTTVLSPVFDITGFTQPIMEYYRWFGNDVGNNPGNDLWEVHIKDENVGNWRAVDRTYASDYSWRRRIFKVREFLPTSNKVQVRIIASDKVINNLPQNGQSTVEGAFDDFYIYDNASALSVNNANPTKANIYPNPANNEVIITLSKGENGSIKLYDITGKELYTTHTSASSTNYSINTSMIANGTYYLVIKGEHTLQSKKITIIH